MAVPSNFGTVGLVFALASLVPWAVFAVLVAKLVRSGGVRAFGLTVTGGGMASR